MPTAAKKKTEKKQSIPTELMGDDTAVLAYQFLAMCRKHLKPNIIPRDVHKLWRDLVFSKGPSSPTERGIAGAVAYRGRRLAYWVFAQRIKLECRGDGKEFDLLQESAERDIAEFVGRTFKCYFPTYWMTEGL